MLSIPEKATQIVEQILSQADSDSSRTIFFVGSKDVGKSTLINAFMNKTEIPKETLLLEYSFGRKSNSKQHIEKNVYHIWEYGGKLETLNNILLTLPVKGQFFYCIFFDLSKLKRLWETVENCVNALNELRSKSDVESTCIMIGGKYDLFKNYDTEVKKIVCTTLRSVAILQNAHLLFYSSKDSALLKYTKDMLNNIGFGNGIPFKEKNINFMKPLIVPKGSDNWESIGISSSTFDEVKLRYISKIGTDPVNKLSVATKSQKSSHPESSVDSLTKLKYDELRTSDLLDITINDYLQSINKQ
ncbi:cytoplasmic dynein 2 light intermediate chain 1 [Manduca sexta]|uniref:cytoplasmic dynein 2 light intermediate chain 1 n=1 Tax=Manduca sexta TaxID=7130 RepID=UPI001182947A|nr:cytoplasmic dynein 2 light intermediate chain 1 [Manduca sexta]XP_030037833.1 cytoplasmic dynein 2 light intermediate chain 1 [Manduca sexta]